MVAHREGVLRAVFSDVGETLVDEERWWRELAERSAALQPRWGRLQPTPPEVALGLDDLASLPEALASLV